MTFIVTWVMTILFYLVSNACTPWHLHNSENAPSAKDNCEMVKINLTHQTLNGYKSLDLTPELIKHLFLLITLSSPLCSKHKEMKTQSLISCRPWSKTHKSSRYKVTWWFQYFCLFWTSRGPSWKKKTQEVYNLHLANRLRLDFKERNRDAIEAHVESEG